MDKSFTLRQPVSYPANDPNYKINGAVRQPPLEPMSRRQYKEVWESVDSTPATLWVEIEFANQGEAMMFMNACKSRKNQSKKHKGLRYERIGNIVWVQGRQNGGGAEKQAS